MDVNTICGARGVDIRAIPEGTSMPESAAPTAQDIEALGELQWALESLGQFVDLRARIMVRLGRANESGGITNHAWEVWGQVSGRLSSETATTASALPLENLISGVITALEEENSVQNEGDLVILRGIMEEYEPFLSGIQTALTDGIHTIAAGVTYDSAKSFKYNIRRITNQIYSRISEDVRGALGYDNRTFWSRSALTADSVQALLGVVRTQTEQACNDYNGLVPEPPAPPVIAPPVTPEIREFEYGINLTPSYAVQLAGDTTAPISSGPLLQGDVAFGYRLNDEIRLQLAYQAMLGVNSFSDWTSDVSYDSGIFSVRYEDLTAQASYIFQRDFANGADNHFGTLGAGYSLFDGYLEPFIGGIFGGNSDRLGGGGFVGLRTSQQYQVEESDLGRVGYSIQVLGTFLYMDQFNVRPGGTAAFTWRPISFGGADLEVSAQVSGLYDAASQGANITPALTLGWNTSQVIRPYPVFTY